MGHSIVVRFKARRKKRSYTPVSDTYLLEEWLRENYGEYLGWE